MPDTFVRFDPSVNFGWPLIGGASVDAVAGMVWAGETVETVADEYNLTTAQVLVACWYIARHGPRYWRRRWRDWLAANEEHFWHAHPEKVADPPAEPKAV